MRSLSRERLGALARVGWPPTRVVATLALCASFCSLAMAQRDSGQVPVSVVYERWFDAADFLLTAEQRRTFERLLDGADDFAKERFIAEFWRSKPADQRERFERNRRLAREMRLRAPAQSEVVRIAGPPAEIEDLPTCDDTLRRMQLWHYRREQLELQRGDDPGPEAGELPEELIVAFVQTSSFDPRSFVVFSAHDAADLLTFRRSTDDPISEILAAAVRRRCIDEQSARSLEEALRAAPRRQQLTRLLGWQREDAAADHLPVSRSTADSERFGPAELDLEITGAYFRNTVVRGEVTVPANLLRTLDGRSLFDRVELLGDVFRGGRLVEAFRVVHHIAGVPPTSGEVGFDFYRKLRPGDYTLNLRVTSADGAVLLRERRGLVVPEVLEVAPEPPKEGGLAQLTRDDLVLLTTLPDVRLRARILDRVGDEVRLQAGTSGGPIAAVEFLRGAQPLVVDVEPPYEVHVRLKTEEETFLAVARDPRGREQARAALRLRREDRPLRVRFAELRDATDPGGEHRLLPVTFSVPRELERVVLRCWFNSLLLEEAELGPTELDTMRTDGDGVGRRACPISRPPFAGLAFARVELEAADGALSEDLVVLSGTGPEELEVLVEEIFVTLVGRDGAPVVDLQPDDFTLRVDGEERTIVDVERVADLPLDIALMIDASSSMGRRVRDIAAGAQRFFERVLRREDRAALLSFSDDLVVRANWSNSVARLRAGAVSMRGLGTTRLYDSIVWGIASFPAGSNRRALVVISDGADTDSDYELQQVLHAARSAGIAIFPVALGPFGTMPTAELRRLAEATGGQFFEVSAGAGLDQIFADIERLLRTQYRLTFRADPEEALRLAPVEVSTSRPGLEVRTALAPP